MNEIKVHEIDKQKNDELAEQQKQIDHLLSQISGSGFVAVLYRTEPKWAEGYLDEFEVDNETGFDIPDIIRTWGGQKIRIQLKDATGKIRGNASLIMKSWKPRLLGKVINRYDDLAQWHPERGMPSRHSGSAPNVPPVQVQQQPQQNPGLDTNVLMKEMFGMFKNFIETKNETASSKERDILEPATVPADPMGQMLAAAEAYKKMTKIFGNAEVSMQQEPADDSNQMFGNILNIAQMMMSNKAQPPQPPPPQLPRQAPQIRPQADKVAPPPPRDAKADLTGLLAQMPADKLSDLLISAVSRMDPSERDQKLGTVVSRFAALEPVQSDIEDDPNGELGDDPEFEEFEEFTTETEDGHNSVQGDVPGPNEADDPSNWQGDN